MSEATKDIAHKMGVPYVDVRTETLAAIPFYRQYYLGCVIFSHFSHFPHILTLWLCSVLRIITYSLRPARESLLFLTNYVMSNRFIW